MVTVPFKDRTEAGKQLAAQPELQDLTDAVVVCLPRGGVPVGVQLALALGSALDVMPVLDLASPGSPEYVVGAVAENAIHVIDSAALEALGVSEDNLAVRVAEATSQIARLAKIYRGMNGRALSVSDRVVVVVDDGSATAPALEAVAVALTRRNVRELILATPLAPDPHLHAYSSVVSVHSGEELAMIGLWYDDFAAPSDEVAAAVFQEFAEFGNTADHPRLGR